MNKLTIALIIAQNGLRTSASMLSANATKLDAQAEAATDKAEQTRLKKKATKTRKLAQILTAADAGITSYISEPD
jgi:hypothetical protein